MVCIPTCTINISCLLAINSVQLLVKTVLMVRSPVVEKLADFYRNLQCLGEKNMFSGMCFPKPTH